MTNHEYDDAYGRGYAHGKEACHSELRAWSPHAPRCGCEPCLTVAAVVKRLLAEGDERHGATVTITVSAGDVRVVAVDDADAAE